MDSIDSSVPQPVFGYPRPHLTPSFSSSSFSYTTPPPDNSRPHLLSLPSELLRQIALFTYSPLYLSQQDRTTWSIFSTVDMDPERWAALETLISLAQTCRRLREVSRGLLFRCVRVGSVIEATEVIKWKDDWGKYVRSIIIDMSMFDPDSSPTPHFIQPPLQALTSTNLATNHSPRISPLTRHPPPIRNAHRESTLLSQMLQSLPNLEHLSFFADSSDDLTLSLTLSPCSSHSSLFKRLTKNLRSLGWRQRESPPEGWRGFMSSSTFISIIGLIEQCNRLGFLVLDADLTSELGVGVGGENDGGMGGGNERIRKEEGMWEEDVWEVLNALEERKRVVDDEDRKEEGKEEVVEAGDDETPRKRSRLTKTPTTVTKVSSSSEMKIVVQTIPRQATEELDDDGDAMMFENRETSGPTTSSMDEGRMEHTTDRRPILRLPSRMGERSDLDGRMNAKSESKLPSPVSLMLCGPIRGWTPSREALGWAQRHLTHLYTRPIGGRGGVEEQQDNPAPDRPRSRQRSELRDMIRDNSQNRGGSPAGDVPPSDYRYPPTSAPLATESPSISSLLSPRDVALGGGPKDDPRPRVFLDGVVERFDGIKELFIDRPVRVRAGSGVEVLKLLAVALLPLSRLPKLTLLQIGGYPLTTADQLLVTNMVAAQCDRLLVVGWLGLEGETNWYGIWRRKFRSKARERQEVNGKQREVVHEDERDGWPWGLGAEQKTDEVDGGFEVKPLADGDLFKLEAELESWEEASAKALALQQMQRESSNPSRALDSGGSHSSASSNHTLGWQTHGPLSSESLASLRSTSVISNSATSFMSSVPVPRPNIGRGSSTESTVLRMKRL